MVDAHVHLWDPARTDWYPYLSRPPVGGPGDASRMYRRFDIEMYRAESAGWNVEKFVNVAAATGPHSIEETIELDSHAQARGGPDAIVGGIPPTDTVAEGIELLDRQMVAPRFRGVRPMGIYQGPLPDAGVLRALQERNLVFELMTHTDQLGTAAAQLEGFDDLVVVVEHTGWPRSGSDEEFAAVADRHRCPGRTGRPRRVQALRSGHALRLHHRRGLRPVAGVRHRGLRRRPLHVRQQLPGRLDVRHLRPALLGVQCRDRPVSTRRRGPSSSPTTPSGSIAAEGLSGR